MRPSLNMNLAKGHTINKRPQALMLHRHRAKLAAMSRTNDVSKRFFTVSIVLCIGATSLLAWCL